jgi:general secretion pathway protein H
MSSAASSREIAAAARRVWRGRDGYVLLELMLAMMLIAMLAGLALPGLARGAGPAALRVTALEAAALLREDRNAAIASARTVTTLADVDGLRSGATGAVVAMPANVALTSPADIVFTPDGRASGGTIVIASIRARAIVSVSPDTGAIRVGVP